MATNSTVNVQIAITHTDINGGTLLRIDDGGNTNVEKLEMGALEFMRTLVATTGLGQEWRDRTVQNLKDVSTVEIKAYADFGGTGAAIKIASIFKALFDSEEAAVITWTYTTGVTVAVSFLLQKYNLPTDVGDLVMTAATVEFAGGAPTIVGI